jgi:hypothetical protein
LDESHATCLSASAERGPIFLIFDKNTHRFTSAEVALRVKSDPPDARSDERAIRDAVVLARVLVPEWGAHEEWVRRALLDLRKGGMGRRIRIGRRMVSTERLEPNGLEGTYANLVITAL